MLRNISPVFHHFPIFPRVFFQDLRDQESPNDCHLPLTGHPSLVNGFWSHGTTLTLSSVSETFSVTFTSMMPSSSSKGVPTTPWKCYFLTHQPKIAQVYTGFCVCARWWPWHKGQQKQRNIQQADHVEDLCLFQPFPEVFDGYSCLCILCFLWLIIPP